MPGLIDLVLALLHTVAAPRHRHHGCRGGQCHRRPILAPASQQPPLSIVPHRRVLESPPYPSPDRPAYRPMEPLDPNASPWGRWGTSCAIHGWGCPTGLHQPKGPRYRAVRGEEEGGEEEDDECRITVVTGLVGAPMIHQMTRISVGPRGRPKGLWHHKPRPHRQPHRP
jgi:hypothetical protein